MPRIRLCEGWSIEVPDAVAEKIGVTCLLSGPGRGDCAHFVGLPGYVRKPAHDGPPTEDVYGKPNGWCWPCWNKRQCDVAYAKLRGEEPEQLRQTPEVNEFQEVPVPEEHYTGSWEAAPAPPCAMGKPRGAAYTQIEPPPELVNALALLEEVVVNSARGSLYAWASGELDLLNRTIEDLREYLS